MEEIKSIYVFAGQSGGGEKASKFKNIHYDVKKRVEKDFKKRYSDVIREFSIIFRVDGKFTKFGEKGVNKMRLMKTQNYITIDIGITEVILDLPEQDILNFVWQEFEKATKNMLEKIKKSKINFDFDEFNKDFRYFKDNNFDNGTN